jgi:hypothetical protein
MQNSENGVRVAANQTAAAVDREPECWSGSLRVQTEPIDRPCQVSVFVLCSSSLRLLSHPPLHLGLLSSRGQDSTPRCRTSLRHRSFRRCVLQPCTT